MATIDVDGMTCAVCVGRVESAILELDGINNVAVNLAKGSANFSGIIDVETVIAAVNKSDIKHQNQLTILRSGIQRKQHQNVNSKFLP